MWLLKFDGVIGGGAPELSDSLGYGRIEYAYHLMARAAGIEMTECRLHQEGGRSHFMTRRFDRDALGRKIHMQTFGALRHFDYSSAGAYGYEQVMQTIRALVWTSAGALHLQTRTGAEFGRAFGVGHTTMRRCLDLLPSAEVKTLLTPP